MLGRYGKSLLNFNGIGQIQKGCSLTASSFNLRMLFSSKAVSEKPQEFLETEDFKDTGLKKVKSELFDYRRARFVDVKLRRDDEIYIPRFRSDDQYLLEHGVVLDHEPMSAFYAMELNDKIYHVFNAERIPYGRMINRIAKILHGKHKPTYRQNEAGDDKDQVLVLNASKMFMRGNKMQKYHLKYHTGYIGRLKTKYYRDLVLDKPEMLVEYSVRRMLPKNWLSEEKIKNLTVLRDQEHDFPGRLPKVTNFTLDFLKKGIHIIVRPKSTKGQVRVFPCASGGLQK